MKDLNDLINENNIYDNDFMEDEDEYIDDEYDEVDEGNNNVEEIQENEINDDKPLEQKNEYELTEREKEILQQRKIIQEDIKKNPDKYKVKKINWVEEHLKCKLDPIYFIENYIKIFNPQEGVVPFKMYDKQKEFVLRFLKYHRVVVVKSRQTGMTTTIKQLQLWLTLFYERYGIGILSYTQDEQNSLLEEIYNMYLTVPKELKPQIKHRIKKRMEFENKSFMKQQNSNNPLRGKPMSTILVDEQQFVPNLKKSLQSVAPTLSRIQKSGLPYGIILNSTPNGTNNFYYEQYYSQVQGKGQYNLFKFHWSEVPEYDEQWYEDRKRELNYDELSILQEYEMEFIGSGETFLSQRILKQINEDINKNQYPYQEVTLDKSKSDYVVKIYEEQKKGEKYIIGVDPSGGLGQDQSSIIVINQKTSEVQQVFNNPNIDDKDLSQLIYLLQLYYNKQLVGVELNGGYGISLVRRLMNELHYPHLYREKETKESDLKPTMGKRKKRIDSLPGIKNTRITRPLILQNMQQYVNEKPSIVKDEELLSQLLVFIRKKNGKVEQSQGYHDDLVMQFSHQLWMRTNSGYKYISSDEQVYDKNLTKMVSQMDLKSKQKLHKQSLDEQEIIDNKKKQKQFNEEIKKQQKMEQLKKQYKKDDTEEQIKLNDLDIDKIRKMKSKKKDSMFSVWKNVDFK